MKKNAAVVLCALAYAAAVLVAAAVGYALRSQHPLIMIAAADAAGTLVIFLFSIGFNNSSFYDPYWSVAPMVIAAYWALSPIFDGVDLLRQFVVLAFVCFWGTRLTFNFLRGWGGLEHEDWRYADLREKNGRAFWFVSFTGIHFVPTILVYLGCLPFYAIFTAQDRPFGLLDGIAAAVTLIAIAFETVADHQLRRFVHRNQEPGRILDTGLWACSRHPNYFGEVLFWWGLFLFAVAADPAQWWTIVGAVSITLLFLFISLPLIENRMAKKPGYAEHAHKIPLLVPWFPQKASPDSSS